MHISWDIQVASLPGAKWIFHWEHHNASLVMAGVSKITWWRHQIETFSALLALCAGNSPVPVNSPHKGQWRGALMFSLIYAWIKAWVNNREAGDLRRHQAHYDVIVMNMYLSIKSFSFSTFQLSPTFPFITHFIGYWYHLMGHKAVYVIKIPLFHHKFGGLSEVKSIWYEMFLIVL